MGPTGGRGLLDDAFDVLYGAARSITQVMVDVGRQIAQVAVKLDLIAGIREISVVKYNCLIVKTTHESGRTTFSRGSGTYCELLRRRRETRQRPEDLVEEVWKPPRLRPIVSCCPLALTAPPYLPEP